MQPTNQRRVEEKKNVGSSRWEGEGRSRSIGVEGLPPASMVLLEAVGMFGCSLRRLFSPAGGGCRAGDGD